MPIPAEMLRLRLAAGPQSGTQMAKDLGISQPTVSRALAAMAGEVLQIGQKKSSRYVLLDRGRGFSDIPVFRVDAQGKLHALGVLTPVRPDGFGSAAAASADGGGGHCGGQDSRGFGHCASARLPDVDGGDRVRVTGTDR